MDGTHTTRRWKRHAAREIISALQVSDAMTRAGFIAPEIAAELGVSVTTLFRWRSSYGGLQPKHIHRILELEAEVRRLRRLIDDLDEDLPNLKLTSTGG